ncbi:hypothetical protein F2Q69_00012549 [Brassica cretica]|uniref:Retrotransposon gag domain-containing protein n=1 Tax=Brassica cretica TaxID=69181 RepID=A0A8S9QXE5_BRACR|nr:hypothetical protein F2Q69_00012549 [Brassica cretica]
MKRGFLGSSKKEPAGLCTIRKSTREESIDTLQATAIDSVDPKSIDGNTTPSTDSTWEKAEKFEVLIVERDDFDLKPIYIQLMSQHPFHGFPHEQPMDHINMFEGLVLFIFNEVFEDHYVCKLFPYTLAGDATHWFKKLPPRSLTTWNDMRDAFLNKFLYDAAENLEIEMESMRRYMVEGDEQHVSGELSRVKEVGTEDTTSTSFDTSTATSIDSTTSTSANGITSESIDSSTSESIDIVTSETIDTDFYH